MQEYRMVSFPARPGGGNPAGVVLDPDPGLGPDALTRWAVRLNPLSETAFLAASAGGDGTRRIRYFAPGGEVELCGHATAAALAVLALNDLLDDEGGATLIAPGGTVRGRAEPDVDGWAEVWMAMPVARRIGDGPPVGQLADALGLEPGVIGARRGAVRLEPSLWDVGIPVLPLPLMQDALLERIEPDFAALRRSSREHGVLVFYPFAFTEGDEVRVRARSFAPAVDIDEDPATGTAVATLAAYLGAAGVLEPASELVVDQGEAMGRPSRLRARISGASDAVTGVEVGGRVEVEERIG